MFVVEILPCGSWNSSWWVPCRWNLRFGHWICLVWQQRRGLRCKQSEQPKVSVGLYFTSQWSPSFRWRLATHLADGFWSGLSGTESIFEMLAIPFFIRDNDHNSLSVTAWKCLSKKWSEFIHGQILEAEEKLSIAIQCIEVSALNDKY